MHRCKKTLCFGLWLSYFSIAVIKYHSQGASDLHRSNLYRSRYEGTTSKGAVLSQQPLWDRAEPATSTGAGQRLLQGQVSNLCRSRPEPVASSGPGSGK